MNDKFDGLQNISNLIAKLGGKNGLGRQKARLELVEHGSEPVQELIAALSDENYHTRWEAIEALGAIGEPGARRRPLAQALLDEQLDIREAAAKSLVHMRRAALQPLLEELVENFDQVWMREGAHTVLYQLKQSHMLTTTEQKVLEALEGAAPDMSAPWAALSALGYSNRH